MGDNEKQYFKGKYEVDKNHGIQKNISSSIKKVATPG